MCRMIVLIKLRSDALGTYFRESGTDQIGYKLVERVGIYYWFMIQFQTLSFYLIDAK